eukprot:1181931-Prorocentrum_minimum.AAC.8
MYLLTYTGVSTLLTIYSLTIQYIPQHLMRLLCCSSQVSHAQERQQRFDIDENITPARIRFSRPLRTIGRVLQHVALQKQAVLANQLLPFGVLLPIVRFGTGQHCRDSPED